MDDKSLTERCEDVQRAKHDVVMEVCRVLYIPVMVEWLEKWLRKMARCLKEL
jgi:hypothetical protein